MPDQNALRKRLARWLAKQRTKVELACGCVVVPCPCCNRLELYLDLDGRCPLGGPGQAKAEHYALFVAARAGADAE